MNVFIAGGGRVGFHVARLLTQENHDVTVVEQDPQRAEQIDYSLDCRTIEGNAASAILLQQSGVSKADLFISATGVDEVNLIAAATAKGLGARQTVARVDQSSYFESNILYETILGIDYILSPEALTALEIAKYVESPGMTAMENFGRGKVQMRQMQVTRSPMAAQQTLKDLDMPQGVLVGMITRKGQIEIPNGNSRIEEGDIVTLVGKRDMIEAFQRKFRATDQKAEHVVIMGGNSLGLHLAQIIENRATTVKLLEWSFTKCTALAAQLKKASVTCRDGTSREALLQEHVDSADIFIATTSDDERNIMASVLAKEVGVSRTVAVVHQPDFASLAQKLGIDHAVTPRATLANRIMRLVHQREVSTLAILEEGKVEVLEFNVNARAPILGQPLREIKFPKGSLVGTILRGEQVIVPKGDDDVRAGDSVVMISEVAALESVHKLFTK